MTKIGIYSGSFDPVHSGHISFALHAKQAANLDEVYFLQECMPSNKPFVEHYGHRVAMLNRATKPYKDINIIELVAKNFTILKTLPRLKQRSEENTYELKYILRT